MIQKKLLLIVVFTSSTTIKTDLFNAQCNDRYTQLLEQQIELLEEQKKSNADIVQLLALQLQLKTALLEEQKEKEQTMTEAAQAQANRPWYEKTWDAVVPALENTVVNFILRALAAKIINSGVSALDHATGDLLAQNGYAGLAIYAGTFIAADSLQQYSQTRLNKITLSDPEIRRYNEILTTFEINYASDIAKGKIVHQGVNSAKLARLGQDADEYLKRAASRTNISLSDGTEE